MADESRTRTDLSMRNPLESRSRTVTLFRVDATHKSFVLIGSLGLCVIVCRLECLLQWRVRILDITDRITEIERPNSSQSMSHRRLNRHHWSVQFNLSCSLFIAPTRC